MSFKQEHQVFSLELTSLCLCEHMLSLIKFTYTIFSGKNDYMKKTLVFLNPLSREIAVSFYGWKIVCLHYYLYGLTFPHLICLLAIQIPPRILFCTKLWPCGNGSMVEAYSELTHLTLFWMYVASLSNNWGLAILSNYLYLISLES